MADDRIKEHREFLKDRLRLQINFHLTDQNQGIEPPPRQKPAGEKQRQIRLPEARQGALFNGVDLLGAISRRRSMRHFETAPLSLAELGLLLWATQGSSGGGGQGSDLRTVPSAGCRHPFETYLLVSDVETLSPGLYRYQPHEHALLLEREMEVDQLKSSLAQGTLGQTFAASAPVCFVWTVIPYRSEWRYHTAAHRVILMDAGHLCQNLYLASAAIGCGTCAIAAYHQDQMDLLLGVDGEDEFTIYLAPVGKVARADAYEEDG